MPWVQEKLKVCDSKLLQGETAREKSLMVEWLENLSENADFEATFTSSAFSG